MSRVRRLLGLGLCLFLLAAGVPALAATSDSSGGTTSAAAAPPQPVPGPKLGGIDPAVGDYRALRSKYSNTFPGDRGAALKAVMYTSPVNYQDATGAWQPIDNTLVPAKSPGYAF